MVQAAAGLVQGLLSWGMVQASSPAWRVAGDARVKVFIRHRGWHCFGFVPVIEAGIALGFDGGWFALNAAAISCLASPCLEFRRGRLPYSIIEEVYCGMCLSPDENRRICLSALLVRDEVWGCQPVALHRGGRWGDDSCVLGLPVGLCLDSGARQAVCAVAMPWWPSLVRQGLVWGWDTTDRFGSLDCVPAWPEVACVNYEQRICSCKDLVPRVVALLLCLALWLAWPSFWAPVVRWVCLGIHAVLHRMHSMPKYCVG